MKESALGGNQLWVLSWPQKLCHNTNPNLNAYIININLESTPKVEDMGVFEVPHGVYVKMECGTWHAGEGGGVLFHSVLGRLGCACFTHLEPPSSIHHHPPTPPQSPLTRHVPPPHPPSPKGPFFQGVDHLDFYNLELSDTNVTDHNTHK